MVLLVLWVVLAGFVGGFGSFWVVPGFSNYELPDKIFKVLRVRLPEATNAICYDFHTMTRLSSGCRS